MTAPLAGQRLLLIRPADESRAGDRLKTALQEAGAAVIELASTRFAPPADTTALARTREALASGGAWDWVAFTSPRAAAALAADDAQRWPGVRVAAVGPATTAALIRAGQEVDLTIEEGGSAALGRALRTRLKPGMTVLLPLGDRAGNDLAEALANSGACVERLEAYRTLYRPMTEADLAALPVAADAIVFTSGSGAEAFLTSLKEHGRALPADARIACLGPRTACDLTALGLCAAIVSPTPDGPALVAALVAALAPLVPTSTSTTWPLRGEVAPPPTARGA